MNLGTSVYIWIALSTIVWLIATTITRARVLRPFRRWVKSRSDYLGEGVSCQYCLSHWVGFAVTAVFRPAFLPMTSGMWIVDLLAHAFAIVGLSALIARTIGKTPPDGVLHPDEEARRREEFEREERFRASLGEYR